MNREELETHKKLEALVQRTVEWPTNNVSMRTLRSRLSPSDLAALFSEDNGGHVPVSTERSLASGIISLYGSDKEDRREGRGFVAGFKAELAEGYVAWGLAANETAANRVVDGLAREINNLVAEETGLKKPRLPKPRVFEYKAVAA